MEEFKLTKKKDAPTIRERKVAQMMQEKEEEEMRELNKKFKAQGLPASINNDKYLAYKAGMERKKDLILTKLNEVP